MKKISIAIALLLQVILLACSSAGNEDKLSSVNNSSKNTPLSAASQACGVDGVWLQVLGSGGPELTDQRASSAYLLWVDGRSRVLVDAGSGSAFNFERAGAKFEELDMILLSHLHVDHSADLPAFIKGSYFTKRDRDLPISGPDGNKTMPATDDFVKRLFESSKGAYQYLGDFMGEDEETSGAYKIRPQVYQKPIQSNGGKIKAQAASVSHGPIPALAWRLDIGTQSIVFSGDMASADEHFIRLLKNADLFVAHNAIPEGTTGVGRRLHMPPSVIGEYAAKGQVKNLLLSHRMTRTLGHEVETTTEIKKHYKGIVEFVDDLDCFALSETN